jgi:hypothetical protein
MRQTGASLIEAAVDEVERTVFRKNDEYGNAFAWDGIEGVARDLIGKYARLRVLVIKNHAQDKKATRDAFLDLAGYGILGLVLCDHPELQPTEQELEEVFPDETQSHC